MPESEQCFAAFDLFFRSALQLPEYRARRGLRYPVGFLAGLYFCAIAARRDSQMSASIWMNAHWDLLAKLWEKSSGSRLSEAARRRGPSQATLSRYLQGCSPDEFAWYRTRAERIVFRQRWQAFLKLRRETGRKAMGAKVNDRRKLARQPNKPIPQYALDGKARAGCVSEATGRHEIDLTLYSPDTKQVLAQRTLADKEGEPSAAVSIILAEARSLPKGIFTGDAGILSPRVVSALAKKNHDFIFGIKGNAGNVFDVIKSHPWDRMPFISETFFKGHGRGETRGLKKISVSSFETPELFAKYKGVAVVFQVTRVIEKLSSGEMGKEVSYYIGGGEAAALTPREAQGYIRDHWGQESFHWVKDVVLGEDASHQKRNNGSRILGILRTSVAEVGMRLFGSTKRFVDHFSADPRKMLEK